MSAADELLAEADKTVRWRPFVHGETPLDFGAKYLFANPETRLVGIRWAHEPPPEASHCIKLTDLLASIPRAALSKDQQP